MSFNKRDRSDETLKSKTLFQFQDSGFDTQWKIILLSRLIISASFYFFFVKKRHVFSLKQRKLHYENAFAPHAIFPQEGNVT